MSCQTEKHLLHFSLHFRCSQSHFSLCVLPSFIITLTKVCVFLYVCVVNRRRRWNHLSKQQRVWSPNTCSLKCRNCWCNISTKTSGPRQSARLLTSVHFAPSRAEHLKEPVVGKINTLTEAFNTINYFYRTFHPRNVVQKELYNTEIKSSEAKWTC